MLVIIVIVIVIINHNALKIYPVDVVTVAFLSSRLC